MVDAIIEDYSVSFVEAHAKKVWHDVMMEYPSSFVVAHVEQVCRDAMVEEYPSIYEEAHG